MTQGHTAIASEDQRQDALRRAWEAVPRDGGCKGFVVDEHKETPGVLAITEDGTLILNRSSTDDFVIVSPSDASGWRISPYNEGHAVRFQWVRDLLH